MRKARLSWTGAAAVTLGGLLMSGCSFWNGNQTHGGTAGTANVAQQVAETVDAADAGGASDAQVAILREAQSAGELTFDQARQAALATFDCIQAGGGSARYMESKE